MKILVMKFRNIGDVLLSTPLIDNLKAAFPEATIDFALNKNCAEMIALHPHVHNLLCYDRGQIKQEAFVSRLWSEAGFYHQVRKNQYDMVINLTEGDRGASLAWLSRAKTRVGILPRNGVLKHCGPFSAYVGDTPPGHTVEKDLFPLRLLKITPLSKRVRIFWDSQTEETIAQILKQQAIGCFVHIHPVARWMFKCWDGQRFAEVIDYLELKKGVRVVISASPDLHELEKVDQILAHCRSAPVNLSGRLSLKEVACLSKHARFFIGVDTGPMHMAAAVDIPVIALFGHSEANVWGPWDNQLETAQYNNTGKTQQNGKHIVIQKGRGEIVRQNGQKISTAMMQIEAEEVKAVIDTYLCSTALP
jgi:heptosyltransferase-3